MKKLLLIGLVLIGGFILSIYSRMEAYCFFYPGIDTQYAPGFSEQVFSQMSTGMTAEVVQQKLGVPLYATTNRDGTFRWYYTLDGKCKWGDWAWMCREVCFHDGRVKEIIKEWRYD